MALNLPWRSTHILRHSYATMALIATIDISSVQASLGHTSSRMTEKYAKVVALLNRDTVKKPPRLLTYFEVFPKITARITARYHLKKKT